MAPPTARPQLRPQLRPQTAPSVTAKKADDDIEDMIQKGRILAEHNVPTFIPGLRASTMIIEPRCPTIGIDQYWRTYWNPRMVKWLYDYCVGIGPNNPCPTCKAKSHSKYAYIAGMWVHEVGHQIFKFWHRMEEAGYTDYTRGNIAQDAEMNDDIPEIGQKIQAWCANPANNHQPCPAMCLPSKCMVNPTEYIQWNEDPEGFFLLTGKDAFDIMRPVGQGLPGDIEIPFGSFPEAVPYDKMKWAQLEPHKIFELYYEQIPDPAPQPGKGKPQPGQGGGKGQGQGQGQGEGSESDGEGQGDGEGEGQGEGQGQGKGGPGKGQEELLDHGSGGGGAQRSWEQGKPGEGQGTAEGITEAEATSVRRDVAARVKDVSKSRGTLPGGWEVWADTQLLPAKVRWEDKLRSMARQAINRVRGERQNTFRRLSRSSVVQDCKVIKPTTYDIQPTVIIVVDTSGSMGCGKGSRLERAISECEAILKLNHVKGMFLDCDANVYGTAQDVKSVSKAKVHGGGGTDMALGVRAAVANKPKPDMVVLITDGYTPWPAAHELKGTRIITAICGECHDNIPGYMNPVWVDTGTDD